VIQKFIHNYTNLVMDTLTSHPKKTYFHKFTLEDTCCMCCTHHWSYMCKIGFQ